MWRCRAWCPSLFRDSPSAKAFLGGLPQARPHHSISHTSIAAQRSTSMCILRDETLAQDAFCK